METKDVTKLPHECKDEICNENISEEELFLGQKDLVEEIVEELDKIESKKNLTEFEKFKNLEKQGDKVNNEISNEEIYIEVVRLGGEMNRLQNNVTSKRVEIVNMFHGIKEALRFISRHMKKWFIAIIIVVYACGIITGGVIVANYEKIEPHIEKIYKTGKFFNNVKNVTNN